MVWPGRKRASVPTLFHCATCSALTPLRLATAATESPFLPALKLTRRPGGRSGASSIMALSAICPDTSLVLCGLRGTSKVEPALTSMRGGMRLTLRSCSSLMPTWRATSAGLSVAGATQAVQVASGALCVRRFFTNNVALS